MRTDRLALLLLLALSACSGYSRIKGTVYRVPPGSGLSQIAVAEGPSMPHADTGPAQALAGARVRVFRHNLFEQPPDWSGWADSWTTDASGDFEVRFPTSWPFATEIWVLADGPNCRPASLPLGLGWGDLNRFDEGSKRLQVYLVEAGPAAPAGPPPAPPLPPASAPPGPGPLPPY